MLDVNMVENSFFKLHIQQAIIVSLLKLIDIIMA